MRPWARHSPCRGLSLSIPKMWGLVWVFLSFPLCGGFQDSETKLGQRLAGKQRQRLEKELAIILPALRPEPTAALPPPWNSINTQLEGLMGSSQGAPPHLLHTVPIPGFLWWAPGEKASLKFMTNSSGCLASLSCLLSLLSPRVEPRGLGEAGGGQSPRWRP